MNCILAVDSLSGSAAIAPVDAIKMQQPMSAPPIALAKVYRFKCSPDFRVCGVAGFQTRGSLEHRRPADLEIDDTAGLETCATSLHADRVGAPSRWSNLKSGRS